MKSGKQAWGWKNALSARGYFGKRIRACRRIWLWSAVLALLCTLITYPGIFYSDSYVRVTTGHAVLNSVILTLKGRGSPLDTGNGFTLIPSFLMAFSIWLCGTVALYTFFQAFLFFAAVLLLIREMNPVWRKTQYVLYACCPLIYGASVYYEAGVGCAAGIIFLMLLFRRVPEEKSRAERAMEFFLIMLFALLVFGYRTNALTLLPVWLIWLLRLPVPKIRRASAVLALAFGIALVPIVPAVFQVRGLSNGMTGFVWEILTTIQRMDETEGKAYQDYLDEVGGEGATRRALAVSTERTSGDFIWGEDLGVTKLSAPGAAGKILKKYGRLIWEKPGEWLLVKTEFMGKTLGISAPLDFSEYEYDCWGSMKEYGFNDSLQRRAFYDSVVWTCGAFGFFTRRPWIMFLLSLGLSMADGRRRKERRKLNAQVFWTALFFYGAFLLVNVSFEVRFFYPALLLMMIADGAILLDLLRDGKAFLQRRLTRTKEASD